MEDSNATTVEFLRARLLSERSVSRTARQRADELAKRVAELEEQLKIVSLLRKKAEKATEGVLAILENHGISDASEAYDSGSDQDTPSQYKVGANSKDGESSVNSKARRNDSEEFSGSEHDSSSVAGTSLSWKGRKHSPVSFEKYKDSSMRRRNSYASAGSAKQHLGKSCRKIRHKELRSAVDELKTKSMKKLDNENNEVTLSSETFLNCTNGGTEKLLPEDNISASLEDQRNEIIDCNSYGRDKDMEKALEHQALLIGRYEEMEKAQREWEEKFRENNSSTPDSNDPGNRSDITEERDDSKSQAPCPPEPVPSQAQEVKSKVEGVYFSTESSKPHLSGFQQPSDVDTGSPAHEFACSMATGKERLRNPDNFRHMHSNGSYHHLHTPPVNHEASPGSSHVGSNFSKGEASGNQNQLYALVPQEKPEGLSGVLEALQQAKLSLQQKIGRFTLEESGPFGKAIEPSHVPKTVDNVEVPAGCPGLFRLPTDFAIEASKPNFLGLGSRSSFGNYYPDVRTAVTADSRFLTGPYPETNRSRVYDQKPYPDLYLNQTVPTSSRYSFPTYPSYNTMPQMLSNGGFSRSVSNGDVRMAPADHFSFYDGPIRTDMYRK